MLDKKTMKQLDIFMLITLPVLAVFLSIALEANFLMSILLFFGMPSFWLSYRTPKKFPKTTLYALFFSIPIGLLIDYLGATDGAWLVPVTIFPFRLFGVIPIEDMILSFFLVFNVIIFYEHFLDKGKHKLVDERMKYFLLPLFIVIAIFISLILAKPEILVIPYAYFWIGVILMLLPSISFLSFFPRLISKYVVTGSYFFLLLLLFEFTGLELGQWSFPGEHFIGWVELFGYSFPFEELFFWCTMSSVGILSYFEFFNDDRK